MQPKVETFWHYVVSPVNRIIAACEGLSESDLNWRPLENANSLYVLATHVMGNVEENMLEILCGQAVHRQRDAEFASVGESAEMLKQRWADLQTRIRSALESVTLEELDRVRSHPRRGEVAGWQLFVVAATHAGEHAGHAELTRDLLLAKQGK